MAIAKQLVARQSNHRRQHEVWMGLFLLAFTLAVRLPYFFDAVINWDESTFILVGQSILKGQLPYTELWDNKPPLAFFFYTGAIALFGKSIGAIRLAGAICVAIVAVCTYILGTTIWTRKTAFFGAMLCVALMTFLPAGQATMTETVALVPLMAALTLLVTRHTTLWTYFAAGILLAVACLIRLNLAYVAVLIGLFPLLGTARQSPGFLKLALAYTSGAGLVIGATVVPYAIANQIPLWWSSVVLAPLSYASTQQSMVELVQAQFANVFGKSTWANLILWPTFLGAPLGCLLVIKRWRSTPKRQQRGIALLMLFWLGTALSILRSGADHGHYLIQLAPFMALLTAFWLTALLFDRSPWTFPAAAILQGCISLVLVLPGYQHIGTRLQAGQPLQHGAAYDIAAYLRTHNPNRAPVYLMTDHLVYWFIDQQPLTPATTHPSNITKSYLFRAFIGPDASPETEMQKVLDQAPLFIVKQPDPWYLNGHQAAQALLAKTLRLRYQRVAEIQGRYIYRRRDGAKHRSSPLPQ